MMRFLILFITTSTILLSGCGFQLRGVTTQLSDKFKATYVAEKRTNSIFYQSLKQLITLNGAQLVTQDNAQITVYSSPIIISSR
ncbi:MAG: hypothetical protein ACWIPH_10580, partial [Ostreibacterium sp.]